MTPITPSIENARELWDVYEEYFNNKTHINQTHWFYGGITRDRVIVFCEFIMFLKDHGMCLRKFFCAYLAKLRNKTPFVILIH